MFKNISTRVIRSILVFVLAMASSIYTMSAVGAHVEATVIAREGDQAPGTPLGTTFNNFFSSVINNDGEVLVSAALAGDAITNANNHGLWVWGQGNLQLLAREGESAPGTDTGVVFSKLSGERLSDNGSTVFVGTIAGPGVTSANDTGIWVGRPGALELLVRAGDPAPSLEPDVVFSLLYSGGRVIVDGHGRVIFTARLAGSGVSDDSFWTGTPGNLELVARDGDPASGTTSVYSFSSISGMSISTNGNGEVVFNSWLSGPSDSNWGIWAGAPGSLNLVVRKGDAVPGAPVGVQFSSLRPPRINDAGEVAFGAFIRGAGVTGDDNRGVWAGAPGALELVIRQGDPAPGLPPALSVHLGSFPGVQGLNTNGLVLFSATLIGTGLTTDNDLAFWFGAPGSMQLGGREGDLAPGTLGDTAFGRIFSGRKTLNGLDEVLFNSTLVGSEIVSSENGLWLATSLGTELIIRTGDLIELAPGEVAPLGLVHQVIAGESLNDQGDVLFIGGFPSYPRARDAAVLLLEGVTNLSPSLVLSGSMTITEGNVASFTFNVTDPDDSSFSVVPGYPDCGVAASLVAGSLSTWGTGGSFQCLFPNGPASSDASIRVADPDGSESATASHTVSVSNIAPSITNVLGPAESVKIGTSATINLEYSDPGVEDTHTCSFNWNDPASDVAVTVSGNGQGGGSCLDTHTYTDPGVYPVDIAVLDNDGASVQTFYHYVVVYDPKSGFVTGGGWIDSPIGAYLDDPERTGRASFGFNAKYKKGKNVPHGNTQFHAAGLNFHSTEYQWLVVAGARAKFKGDGTVNGQEGYGFMLTAADGKINGGGGVDRFRIKIWDKTTNEVVYDNQRGEADDSNAITELGGGSIVIHGEKRK